MSRPIPFIYLPRVEDQQRLCRALWEIGYKGWATGHDVNKHVAHWTSVIFKEDGTLSHPYTVLTFNGKHWDGMTHEPGVHYTRVNSIAHFIAYTKARDANP